MTALDFIIGYATIKPLIGHAVAANPNNLNDAQVRMNWFSHTDTTVFVWEPHGGVGHAAIMIGDAPSRHLADGTDFYASWFPGGAGAQEKGGIMKDLGRIAELISRFSRRASGTIWCWCTLTLRIMYLMVLLDFPVNLWASVTVRC